MVMRRRFSRSSRCGRQAGQGQERKRLTGVMRSELQSRRLGQWIKELAQDKQDAFLDGRQHET